MVVNRITSGVRQNFMRSLLSKILTVTLLTAVGLLCLFGCGKSPDESNPSDKDHTHKYTVSTIAPSCTAVGKMTFTCNCGDTYTEDIPATGHVPVKLEAVAPTCTEPGHGEGVLCSVCGEVLEGGEEIPALNHNETVLVKIEPTCTMTGLTEGLSCARCNAILIEQQEIPALPHTEIVVEGKAPTCEEDGLTDGIYCSSCDDMIIPHEIIPATRHTVVMDKAVDPTCAETGLTMGSHCSVCDKVIVEQKELPALGHKSVTDEAVDPTCTKTGRTEGAHCSVCSEVLIPQVEIPAKGHTEYINEALAPTCTEPGHTEGRHCTVCYTVLLKQETIPATGHTEVVVEAVAPTCTETGRTEGKKCTVCNTMTVSSKIIQPLGHTYTETTVLPSCEKKGYTIYTCHCGYEYYDNYLPSTGHTVIVLAAVSPTCTATGLTEGKKCGVCEKILVAQRVVSTIPHNYDKTEVTAPTCTEQGYTTYLCQCGESMVGSYVAATGHKSILALGVNPTCTEPGISNGRKCRVCNEVLSGLTPLAPTGHKYEESTVLPTCTKEGLSTFTCHCGDFYTESIAPTGHTSVTDIALFPTCTEPGLTEGAHCSVCSEVLVKQEAVPALGHTFAHGIRCDACPIYKGSEGLCFELNADGKGYTVIGMGECTDTLLIIPESHLGLPVTAVGERAFASCNTITAAIIANNVINIYSQAFEYCDNLMHVTIGESVEKIYSDPFHCDRLVEISNKSTHFTLSTELASYNQVIGIYNAGDDHTSRLFLEDGFVIYDGGEDKTVVNYLGNQSDASLPSYVTKINRHAFSYCDSLASITVPDNVTNIGQYAFYHCAAKIIWGENPKLTTIPEHAFAFYEHINFIVPKGVTSIENRAFYYSGLMAVEIPDTVTTVGERAFFYCGNLQKIKIPDSVTSMGKEAFSTCYGMTDVEIGNGLTVIPQSAFYACVSLKSVFIGTGVSTIEFEAFRGCTPLGRIAIPDNVKVVDKWAFYDCPELEIYCEATLKPSGWSDEWTLSNRPVTWGCTILNGVALIPNEDGISYSAVGTIRPFSGRVDIPSSHNQKEVTALCDNAFSTVEIMEVSIPATVKSIGKDLFFGQGPKNIFYEGTLEQWAQIDFKWYMSPFNLYVGEKLVTDVVFDSTLEISDWAFSGCVSIETVKISHGSSVVRLGENSFHRCENLKTVVLGKGVSTISREAFSHCSSLLSVTLADNLIFIEENAFNNCVFLSSITVLGQSLSVAELAFNGCDKLEKIYYMGTITDWFYFVIIENNNAPLTGSRVYYYTSSAPGVEGYFWHYGENGEVVEWPPIEKEAQAA